MQFNDYDFEEWKDVEKKVLSSFIFYYSQIIDTHDIESIPLDYFCTPEAKMIFQTLLDIEAVNATFDMTVLCNHLKGKCHDKQLLNSSKKYLLSLNQEFQHFNIDKYINILNQQYIKTQLNTISKEIIKTNVGYDEFNDVIARWEYGFLQITSQDKIFNFLTAQDVFLNYEAQKKDLEDDKKILKTNYLLLDQKIQGFCPGQLLVIASRPGVGKTTFALNLINQNLHNIKQMGFQKEVAIGFFSLEMKNETLMEKLISINSDIPVQTIRSFRNIESLNSYQQNVYKKTKNMICESNLLFCDSENITLGKLVANIKMWCRKYEVKLIIIDYLQLINIPNDKDFLNMSSYQKIGIISRRLKTLSLELKICILSLAQLNRKAEERTHGGGAPILSDLRESGSIEQDADIVMFLYKNKNKNKGIFDEDENPEQTPADSYCIDDVSLKIGKNRHGPIGQIDFIFDKNKGIFTVNLGQ